MSTSGPHLEQILINEQLQILKQIFYGRKKPVQDLPKEYEDFFQDCAKISLFLQNNDAVLEQLKILNTLVKEEAKKRGVAISEEQSGDYLKHKKVLRSVLELELAKIGFAPDFGKALSVLEPNSFALIYSKGIILKDPGAGTEHGEFTHAIQWLLIAWQQKNTSFLSLPVIKIYNKFGDSDKFKSIWNAVVDENKEACFDARSPERLHQMILSSDDPELSALKALCQSRVNKREMDTQKNNFFSEKKDYPKKEYTPSEDENLLLPRKKL
ncbi:LirA/MavJ family T4SS effector [Legionella sp. WA2022007384]